MDLLFKEIDMLSGLEIVLERIKEYPEELPKWSDLLGEYIQYFNEEEVQAWRDVQIQMGRERFNEKVLKRLDGNEVQETVVAFQNEIAKIVAGKQQRNAVITSGSTYGAAQQVMYNPYANNNR